MTKPEKSLFSYIVAYDWGLAPNPWGEGTLAACKPGIRRSAQEGDWVVGLSPKPDGYNLVFAMIVGEILTHGEYFRDPRFEYKKPNFQTTDIKQWVGDNFYEESEGGYIQHLSGHSKPDGTENEKKKRRDLSGRNVLIASFLYYFGDQSPKLSPKLDFLRVGMGYRRLGVDEILKFERHAGKHLQSPGVFGEPSTLEKWTSKLKHFSSLKKSETPNKPNQLLFHAPGLIEEALATIKKPKTATEKAVIEEIFTAMPNDDKDRTGWLRQLGLACAGYKAAGGVSASEDVCDQLASGGYKDWLTAWNTIRWIPGQAERMRQEFDQYKDKAEFPWLTAIIGLIIMLVRLDHPEYQKQPTS